MAKKAKIEVEEPLEKKLWKAADKLRKNMDAAEYKHVALGLIFLKYISDAFEEVYNKLKEGKGDYEGASPEDKNEYVAEKVFYVPPSARWTWLQGYIDSLLTQKLIEIKIIDYRILRYRDDYRIFSNNAFESEQITKVLSEILSDMGLKLNADKTESSDNVIKSSIKPDKRYWIANKRIAENKQKWLIQLYLLSENFPNSGTLDTQMRDFLRVIQTSDRKDPNIETLISLVVEIAFRNPRVCPTSVAVLTILLNQLKSAQDRKNMVERIRKKFLQIPNSSLLKIWLQRLYIKIDDSIEYDELLCQKVLVPKTQIWNSEWLNPAMKKLIDDMPIVDYAVVNAVNEIMTELEIESIVEKRAYEYQE